MRSLWTSYGTSLNTTNGSSNKPVANSRLCTVHSLISIAVWERERKKRSTILNTGYVVMNRMWCFRCFHLPLCNQHRFILWCSEYIAGIQFAEHLLNSIFVRTNSHKSNHPFNFKCKIASKQHFNSERSKMNSSFDLRPVIDGATQ